MQMEKKTLSYMISLVAILVVGTTVSILIPTQVKATTLVEQNCNGYVLTTYVGGEMHQICIPQYIVIDRNIIPPVEIHINPKVIEKLNLRDLISVVKEKGFDNVTIRIPTETGDLLGNLTMGSKGLP